MADKTITVHRSIDEIGDGQWNNVVDHADRGSVFHRAGWLRAVEEGLGRPARHLVVENGGNPVGVFPNFLVDIDLPEFVPHSLDGLVSKRVTSIEPGFGGPLFVGSEQSNFEFAFEHVDRLFADIDAVNHRVKPATADFVRYSEPLADYGYRPTVTSCRFVVDLSRGWDAIESGMNGSKRSNLRKARENSATVERESLGESSLEQFYGTYRKTMERVDGTLYPFEFFRKLGEQLPERTKLFTVEVDGTFAGGQLYLLDEERSTMYEFFRGIDDRFFDYYPSELLAESAMKWGINRGYDEYDLGSTSPDFTDGSFNYKAELGAEPRPIVTWERGCSAVQWPLYRLGRWYLRTRTGSKSGTKI